MKKTILCHFRNEEWMLPWFLNHHKQMFDHGIMIDYHSTDNSRAVIKKICPDWEIVTSRNPDFQADNIDTEVNDIERDIDGWKICLNVTEQLIGDYSLMDDDIEGKQLLVPSIFMVDCERDTLVTQDKPLWEQKHHGFTFNDSDEAFLERRSRSLHNYALQYPLQSTPECMSPGRHWNGYNTKELVTLYWGWSPFDQGQLDRKLQIQTQIPLIDRQRNWGFHHITNADSLTYRLENEFIPRARDISKDLKYYVDKHFSNIL
jgi:hypothetical protein|tara:strand:+ start:1289 stop:2071 length:783 start_codon:yes stop_codon:yes gene_type:complete